MSERDVVIRVENVSKLYRLGAERIASLLEVWALGLVIFRFAMPHLIARMGR